MNKEVTLTIPVDKVKFKIDKIDNKITVVVIKVKPFDVLIQISDKKINEYMKTNEKQSSKTATPNQLHNSFDWLEEIPEHKRPRAEYGEKYHYINDCGDIGTFHETDSSVDDFRYSIGDYGLTREELEAKREYNIARQVLLDDADGGKFTQNTDMYRATYNKSPHIPNKWNVIYTRSCYNPGSIYFKTEIAIRKSFKEHKKQWEIVRKYETGEK